MFFPESDCRAERPGRRSAQAIQGDGRVFGHAGHRAGVQLQVRRSFLALRFFVDVQITQFQIVCRATKCQLWLKRQIVE
jgi:hypothetical protein